MGIFISWGFHFLSLSLSVAVAECFIVTKMKQKTMVDALTHIQNQRSLCFIRNQMQYNSRIILFVVCRLPTHINIFYVTENKNVFYPL